MNEHAAKVGSHSMMLFIAYLLDKATHQFRHLINKPALQGGCFRIFPALPFITFGSKNRGNWSACLGLTMLFPCTCKKAIYIHGSKCQSTSQPTLLVTGIFCIGDIGLNVLSNCLASHLLPLLPLLRSDRVSFAFEIGQRTGKRR